MIDRSKPVAQWPDCQEKYDKLMEEFKATPAGKKFLDEQFKKGEESLGPSCLNRGIHDWIRASEHPEKKCVLYKDTVTHLDVVQGALGDCYFLSAISVLGEANVKSMILTKEEDWK